MFVLNQFPLEQLSVFENKIVLISIYLVLSVENQARKPSLYEFEAFQKFLKIPSSIDFVGVDYFLEKKLLPCLGLNSKNADQAEVFIASPAENLKISLLILFLQFSPILLSHYKFKNVDNFTMGRSNFPNYNYH